jgi:antitoxin component of RelBE/YafQ-DinJ toxin-antitoxin module
MESFVIHIPNKKANLVKQLLKELGVTIDAVNNNLDDSNKNHIPNKETLKAIKEVKQGKGVKFASVNDLFASIK